jgi:kinesin family member C1
LKVEDVTNGGTIQSLLDRAKKNRMVAATNCNERSSRSHSVFVLKIRGNNSITSEACTGTLNLVRFSASFAFVP